MSKTRKLTAAALITAVSVVFVYFASISPTSKLALIGCAGIAVSLIVAESGPIYGLAVCVVTSIITILTVPAAGVIYAVLFGWYPSVKSIIEKLNKRVHEWCLKILVYSGAFAVLYLLFPKILSDTVPKFAPYIFILYFIGCAAFVLYDICLSMVISYYLRVIYPKIRK